MSQSLQDASQELSRFLERENIKVDNPYYVEAYINYCLRQCGINPLDGTEESLRFVSAAARLASHPGDTAHQATHRATPPEQRQLNTTVNHGKIIDQQILKYDHDLKRNRFMKSLFLFGLSPEMTSEITAAGDCECWELMQRYRAHAAPNKFTKAKTDEIKADLQFKKGDSISQSVITMKRTIIILTTRGHMTPELALEAIELSIGTQPGGAKIVLRYKHETPDSSLRSSDGLLNFAKLHWTDREIDPVPHPVLAAIEDPTQRRRRKDRGTAAAAAADGFADGGGRGGGGRLRRGDPGYRMALEYFLTPSPHGMQPHFVAPPAADRYEYCFAHGWNKSHPGHRCRSLRDDTTATPAMKAANSPAPLVANNGIRYLASSEIRPN